MKDSPPQDSESEKTSRGGRPRLALLLFPAALFVAAYALDKVFYLGEIEDYFLRTASFVNYEQKEHLLRDLSQYLRRPGRRKVIVMFGNSRTTTFSLAKLEARNPGWTMFNFSVPGGNVDYYYYLMTRFKRLGLRPEYAFFSVDPQGYNTSPRISMDEVMLNGLPVSFVAANAGHFSVSALSNYAAKKLFWNYQYRPKLSIAYKKLRKKKVHIDGFRFLQLYTYYLMALERGSIRPYGQNYDAAQNIDRLKASAAGTKRDFLTPYSLDEHQFYFTERVLALTREMQIPSALLWAKVGGPLRDIMDRDPVLRRGRPATTIRKLWEPRVRALAARQGGRFLDMNYAPAIKCDRFLDASHLAGVCFVEFADYLVKQAAQR